MKKTKKTQRFGLRLVAIMLLLAVCFAAFPIFAGAETTTLKDALLTLADQENALITVVLSNAAENYNAEALRQIAENSGLGENCPSHDALAFRIAELVALHYNPAILIANGSVDQAGVNAMLQRCYRLALAEYALENAMQDLGDRLILQNKTELGQFWKNAAMEIGEGLDLFELILVEEAYRGNYYYEKQGIVYEYKPVSAVAEALVTYCNETYYVDRLWENGIFTQGLIYSYMHSIGDDYSSYLTEESKAENDAQSAASFAGIGVELRVYPTKLVEVLYVYEGSPAEKAGFLAGDIITHVDGVSLENLSSAEINDLLRGETNTEVTLTVKRGEETLTLSAIRSVIPNKTVFGRLLREDGKKIGYVRITKFRDYTYNEFVETVTDLQGNGAEALIFDVRNNRGGDLHTVLSMLAWLLPKTSDVVQDGAIARLQYKDVAVTYSETGICYYWRNSIALDNKVGAAYDPAQNEMTLPMTVLCNEASYSAAELFASCLQDWEVAHIIGKTTHGKGFGQSGAFLKNLVSTKNDGCRSYVNSYLSITVFAYEPPLSGNYEGKGVIPDEEITLSDEAKALHFSKITTENDAMLAGAVSHLQKVLEKQNEPISGTVLAIALTGICTVTVILAASIILTLVLGKHPATQAPQTETNNQQNSDTSDHTKGE